MSRNSMGRISAAWARVSAVAVTAVVALAVGAAPAQAETTALASGGPSASDTCSGWNGVASNFGNGALGILSPAILQRVDLGTPYVDGDVIRANNSMTFANWGSCGAQVAFQMQTKACGTWGCSWETRNHGTWEFLWQHADDGEVSGQVGMSCRAGTHSYRVHMAVLGPVSTGGSRTRIQEQPGPREASPRALPCPAAAARTDRRSS